MYRMLGMVSFICYRKILKLLVVEADYPKCQHMELVESLKCDGCLAATDYLGNICFVY